jgi:hypothetical protein
VRVRSVPRAVAGSLLALMVLSGGVAIGSTRVRAHPSLPTISPDHLIAAVVRSAEQGPPVSGTVEARVDLGLPTFPLQGAAGGAAGTGVAGLLSELTGDHRVRLWSSQDGYRADELLPTAERALYVSRQGGWLWSSDAYTAYELFDAKDVAAFRPAAAAANAERSRLMHLADPLTLVRGALSALSPTTSVSMGPAVRVAGRPAYVLVLTPKDPSTLVGRVEFAVDAVTYVPLSVGVFARGAASPAISARFSSVSYRPIAPSVYRFSPPSGATVKQLYQGGLPQGRDRTTGMTGIEVTPGSRGTAGAEGVSGDVRSFGLGWSSILAVRVPAARLASGGSVDGIDLRQFLPFSGPLFSVRLVARGDHDWLLVGAVAQSALADVEPQLP